MEKRLRKMIVMLMAAIMLLAGAMPVSAASKYGEEKPLKSVSKTYCYEEKNGKHKHYYIDANNGVRYLMYDSCMNGMVGTTPTNHASTVTIDGVRYSLCNYGYKNKWCSYANVIKKIGSAGTASNKTPAATRRVALTKIRLNKSSLTVNAGNTAQLSVSYVPVNTTDSKKVSWSSSNSGIVAVNAGRLTAKKPGTATITAKVGTKTAFCKVTVKAPLKAIVLNKTSASLTAGSAVKLTVSYNPGNTTDSRYVAWSSSNTGVAVVSGGKVTAKKAGTATITARVGTKTATCKVTVKAASSGSSSSASTGAKTDGGNYRNVSDAYRILNEFRTSRANQWYWNPNNTTKTTTYGLQALRWDGTLENVAKTRAKEQWIMYYEKGRLTHDRPNGMSWDTAYPAGISSKGENLAWGQTSCRQVITDPNSGWAETNCMYQGQGHRRNMLNSGFTRVGIACYEKDGKTCWAMCLGR